MSTLYERLSSLCREHGIKGAKMCRDLGFSKSMMTDLKMGRKQGISANSAHKIAEYFDVSVGYLLGEETEKQPTEDDGLSESKRVLIEFARTVPEDKIEMVLRVMRSIVEAD